MQQQEQQEVKITEDSAKASHSNEPPEGAAKQMIYQESTPKQFLQNFGGPHH